MITCETDEPDQRVTSVRKHTTYIAPGSRNGSRGKGGGDLPSSPQPLILRPKLLLEPPANAPLRKNLDPRLW